MAAPGRDAEEKARPSACFFFKEARVVAGWRQLVRLIVDSQEMQVGSAVQLLDCAPRILDGRTYVPARAVFESFGYQVQWNSYGRSVYLQKAE